MQRHYGLPVTEKRLYHFACERKDLEKLFNINSELSQNRTEKQIMPFKTTVNWLFNPKTAGERGQDTSFLKISLNFLKSFRRYEEILCQ